ncbi:MAG: hypothetical protein LC808_09715, partial [Actinobacteria bacterium]|nr:hypothetical protein [Actinomycetota bacterium]
PSSSGSNSAATADSRRVTVEAAWATCIPVSAYPVAMSAEGALGDLERFAISVDPGGLRVHRAAVALDERQDGEPVTRVVLLVDEPQGDTWDVGVIQDLRTSLARKATELRLPPPSLTLVPESEAEVVEAFARQ